MCICRWYDLTCKKPQRFPTNNLKLINNFSKGAGYKLNTQKLVAFLHTKNEQSAKKIKRIIYNSIKKNKILQNEFKQGDKNLYNDNYNTLLKELKNT